MLFNVASYERFLRPIILTALTVFFTCNVRFFANHQDEMRKQLDKERKKAEVRRQLEEAAQAKKGKKGFMTADRKKRLRASAKK